MQAKFILLNFIFDTIKILSSSIDQIFIEYNNFDNIIFYDAIEVIRKQLIAIAKAFLLL